MIMGVPRRPRKPPTQGAPYVTPFSPPPAAASPEPEPAEKEPAKPKKAPKAPPAEKDA